MSELGNENSMNIKREESATQSLEGHNLASNDNILDLMGLSRDSEASEIRGVVRRLIAAIPNYDERDITEIELCLAVLKQSGLLDKMESELPGEMNLYMNAFAGRLQRSPNDGIAALIIGALRADVIPAKIIESTGYWSIRYLEQDSSLDGHQYNPSSLKARSESAIVLAELHIHQKLNPESLTAISKIVDSELDNYQNALVGLRAPEGHRYTITELHLDHCLYYPQVLTTFAKAKLLSEDQIQRAVSIATYKIEHSNNHLVTEAAKELALQLTNR